MIVCGRRCPQIYIEAARSNELMQKKGGVPMDQISIRTIVLLLVGGLTAFVAFHDPATGVAIAVAAAVIALLHQLMTGE